VPARTYTDAELRAAVAVSRSFSGVLRELGLRVAGGNIASIRRAIDRAGFDRSHFDHDAPRRRHGVTPRPLEEVLVRGSSYQRSNLKQRLYDTGLKQRRCELCGQDEAWQGRRMALILDHINGEADDNRLENLRIICPNCNATLDTHCGRRNRRTVEDQPCQLCSRPFRPRTPDQRFCSRACGQRGKHVPPVNLAQRRVARPPEAQLRAEVEADGFLATGRRYGVSDNAIRKWLRAYERERERARREDVGSMSTTTKSDDDLFGAEHVRVYRETGGERGYHWRGTEILLLTTTGRKSGEQKTLPLIFRADGDRYVIVASKGGAPDHPAWFKNMEANPDATVQVRDDEVPVRMHVAEGEERERLWKLMTEVWPAYDDYQARTDRQIPVVVLAPR
jgi:deazaflavin-dependent oxidoreductase (nitroreductase family)